MLAWSPLLIQQIEIRALGFVLRKLQLNRHRDAEVAPHRHRFSQLVLYLSGEGVQIVAGRRYVTRTGDLFIIPAGTNHGFVGTGRMRPLCFVLDYDLRGAPRPRVTRRHFATAQLNELHGLLARLPKKGRLSLSDYPAILAVVAQLLDRRPRREPLLRPGLFDQVRELLKVPRPVRAVAQLAGYHPDHLNRRLKQESGIGLRALRDRIRLEAAQSALQTATSIAEAATRSGFDDPNYFSRWYRRQTGLSPARWRQRQRSP